MTPRQKRMVTVVAILAGVGVATPFALQAFQKNLLYYYSPTQIKAGEAPSARSIRVGGLVEQGSFTREPGSLEAHFTLTDVANTLTVRPMKIQIPLKRWSIMSLTPSPSILKERTVTRMHSPE